MSSSALQSQSHVYYKIPRCSGPYVRHAPRKPKKERPCSNKKLHRVQQDQHADMLQTPMIKCEPLSSSIHSVKNTIPAAHYYKNSSRTENDVALLGDEGVKKNMVKEEEHVELFSHQMHAENSFNGIEQRWKKLQALVKEQFMQELQKEKQIAKGSDDKMWDESMIKKWTQSHMSELDSIPQDLKSSLDTSVMNSAASSPPRLTTSSSSSSSSTSSSPLTPPYSCRESSSEVENGTPPSDHHAYRRNDKTQAHTPLTPTPTLLSPSSSPDTSPEPSSSTLSAMILTPERGLSDSLSMKHDESSYSSPPQHTKKGRGRGRGRPRRNANAREMHEAGNMSLTDVTSCPPATSSPQMESELEAVKGMPVDGLSLTPEEFEIFFKDRVMVGSGMTDVVKQEWMSVLQRCFDTMHGV